MINEKTSLPFKILVPLCSLLILCTWKIGQGFSVMNSRLDDTWTISHQESWARQMRKINVNVNVPDAREIFDDVNAKKPRKPITISSYER